VCCCLWLVIGGVLAAWLMQQGHPHPVTPLDGAAVGFLAGIAGSVVYLVIAWPVAFLVGPMMEAWVERAIENAGNVPLRDILEQYRGGGARTVGVVLGFVLQLVLGMVFTTLGGVLGAMLFKKPGPPVPPPPGAVPPTPWTPPPPPALPEIGPPPGPDQEPR
jgi:hypothetical protein